MTRTVAALLLSTLALAACGGSDSTGTIAGPTAAPAGQGVQTEVVAEGFDKPVAVATLDDGRLLVLEQHAGRVRLVDGTEPGATLLDLGSRVSDGTEQGLLGIALDPDDDTVVYLNRTDEDGDTVISRWRREGDRLDTTSEEILLEVDQPHDNHNGGHLAFGPDGRLWIGLGDGGDAGDPEERAQNPDDLLGKLLRLDVDRPDATPEVWALGLRNPWRYAFDGDRLWVADVGQKEIEEVNRLDATVPAGQNLGWDLWEGSRPYENDDGRIPDGYVPPLAEYTHDDGCSVTGGIVVRDPSLPALDGRYIYADYCSGRVWALPADAIAGAEPEEITALLDEPLEDTVSFGTDGNGHPLAVLRDGRILRLVAR